jgi:hypothetical protein
MIHDLLRLNRVWRDAMTEETDDLAALVFGGLRGAGKL